MGQECFCITLGVSVKFIVTGNFYSRVSICRGLVFVCWVYRMHFVWVKDNVRDELFEMLFMTERVLVRQY